MERQNGGKFERFQKLKKNHIVFKSQKKFAQLLVVMCTLIKKNNVMGT